MKKFKILDVYISITLILSALMFIPFDGTYAFVCGYLILGGWHCVSMLVHAIKGWFVTKEFARIYYHWTVAVVIVFAGLALLIKSLMMMLMVVMLIAGPIMAIIYTRICYNETFKLMKRPLDDLK
jgi:hypothetical protein